MRAALLGLGGQVGTEIARLIEPGSLRAFTEGELDITDPAAVESALAREAPDVIINAAAYTAVDRAEEERDLAFAVNRDAVHHLARCARSVGASLIHFSTDYVFDGEGTRPYREDDPPHPLGVYGRSKWEGEEALRRALPEHIIIRTSWVFSALGQNFVKTMLRLAREREELRVVSDQTGCPTSARDLARLTHTLVGLIAAGAAPWGTFHFCGTPATTWHGFAEAVVAAARRREELRVNSIVPVSTAEYPTAAARPRYSVLDCGLVAERCGVDPPPWGPALEETVQELSGA